MTERTMIGQSVAGSWVRSEFVRLAFLIVVILLTGCSGAKPHPEKATDKTQSLIKEFSESESGNVRNNAKIVLKSLKNGEFQSAVKWLRSIQAQDLTSTEADRLKEVFATLEDELESIEEKGSQKAHDARRLLKKIQRMGE